MEGVLFTVLVLSELAQNYLKSKIGIIIDFKYILTKSIPILKIDW